MGGVTSAEQRGTTSIVLIQGLDVFSVYLANGPLYRATLLKRRQTISAS